MPKRPTASFLFNGEEMLYPLNKEQGKKICSFTYFTLFHHVDVTLAVRVKQEKDKSNSFY